MSLNYVENTFADLKKSPYPIFIWGAGSMSLEVEKRLKENEILSMGKFVNIDAGQSHIVSGKDYIYTLKDIEANYEKIDVVVGHGHYEKADELRVYPFINRVYIIPNPYLQYKGPDLEYVQNNRDKINYIFSCLEDEKSCQVLEKYILFCQTNDITHLLESNICIPGMYSFKGLKISESENFVDVGAWQGDTIDSFLKTVNGKYEYIYAVEPNCNSFEILERKFKLWNNVILIQCGLSEENGKLYLEEESSQSTFLQTKKTNKIVEVRTLDDLFLDKNISLVKICVPFMFLNILKGGRKIIKQNRPRLIINVAADDKFSLYETVKWIVNLGLGYKLSLRFDFPMPTRMHLYAY